MHYRDPRLVDGPDGPEGPHQVLRVGRRAHRRQVARGAYEDDGPSRDGEALQSRQEDRGQITKSSIFYLQNFKTVTIPLHLNYRGKVLVRQDETGGGLSRPVVSL